VRWRGLNHGRFALPRKLELQVWWTLCRINGSMTRELLFIKGKKMTIRTCRPGRNAATALLLVRLCAAVSVGALFLVVTSTVAAASPSMTCSTSWTAASTPATHGFLDSVAAVSASDVWAVGQNYSNSTPLIERWNGSAWHVVKSPSLSGNLRSVFKVTATDIWAVGSTPTDTLIENWNGTNWSVVPSPSPGNNTNALFSVSGTSSSDIWAVGNQSSQQGSTSTESGLIEHWNGSAWSVSATPPGIFLSVQALSPSDAWAAGYSGETGNQEVLAQWNGSQWTTGTGPAGNNYIINGMSKRSSAALGWAAGEYALRGTAKAQMLRWSTASDSWHPVHTPLPSGNSALSSVVQVSASDAWAVGDVASPAGKSLIEHWDGSQWTIDPAGTVDGDLSGVAVSGGNVKVAWAVGGQGATSPPLVLTRCA
jgi:hypothetical protein